MLVLLRHLDILLVLELTPNSVIIATFETSNVALEDSSTTGLLGEASDFNINFTPICPHRLI